MTAGYSTQGAYSPDSLLAGETNLVTRKGTLISGENLVRGALLGKITSGGKLNLSLSAAVDGSEVPFGILAEDADASAGDVECVLYVKGHFNEDSITYGTAHTADSVREGLRDIGIHTESTVAT